MCSFFKDLHTLGEYGFPCFYRGKIQLPKYRDNDDGDEENDINNDHDKNHYDHDDNDYKDDNNDYNHELMIMNDDNKDNDDNDGVLLR